MWFSYQCGFLSTHRLLSLISHLFLFYISKGKKSFNLCHHLRMLFPIFEQVEQGEGFLLSSEEEICFVQTENYVLKGSEIIYSFQHNISNFLPSFFSSLSFFHSMYHLQSFFYMSKALRSSHTCQLFPNVSY